MARLRDVPYVVRKVGPWGLLKRVYGRINGDNLFTWASALAYSWLFAIFPFFVFLMTLLPYLPNQYKSASKENIKFAVMQLPEESYKTVWGVIEPRLDQLLNQPPKGVRIIGILLTLWAASGGMATTMSAVDRAYSVKKFRPFWVQRPLAGALTIVAAVLIIAVIVLIPVGTIVIHWIIAHIEFVTTWLAKHLPAKLGAVPMFVHNHLDVLVVLWQVIRFGLAFFLMFGLVSVVYHFGPNLKQKWRAVTPGAVFSIAIWMLLGSVFRVYIDKFGKYNETYGAVGGVAILLLFFYIDALVLLVGAEINSEIDYEVLGIERGTVDLKSAEERRIAEAIAAREKRKPEQVQKAQAAGIPEAVTKVEAQGEGQIKEGEDAEQKLKKQG